MKFNTPDRNWRDMMIRATYVGELPPDVTFEQAFLQQSEHQYNKHKDQLDQLLARNGTPSEIKMVRIYIYVSAIAWLTYGRLGVVADILNNVPEQPSPLAALYTCVEQIIPVPRLTKGSAYREAVLKWVQDHNEKLEWDEEEGRFKLIP